MVMLTDLFEITEASVHFSAPFQMYLFGRVNKTREELYFGNFRNVEISITYAVSFLSASSLPKVIQDLDL